MTPMWEKNDYNISQEEKKLKFTYMCKLNSTLLNNQWVETKSPAKVEAIL